MYFQILASILHILDFYFIPFFVPYRILREFFGSVLQLSNLFLRVPILIFGLFEIFVLIILFFYFQDFSLVLCQNNSFLFHKIRTFLIMLRLLIILHLKSLVCSVVHVFLFAVSYASLAKC